VWKPARLWTAGQLIVGIALVALLPVVDRLGWVLLIPVAVGMIAGGVRDALLRPTLSADTAGLRVVDGLRHIDAAWADVERLRTVRDRRTPLLEIDLGAHLIVLSRRRLGAPVDDVLAKLLELRQAS
jgi:hypothetical protein